MHHWGVFLSCFLAAPQHEEDKIWGRDKGPPSAATRLSFLVDLACKTDEFPDALQLVPSGYRPFCVTNPTIRKSEHPTKTPFFPHDYTRRHGCDRIKIAGDIAHREQDESG